MWAAPGLLCVMSCFALGVLCGLLYSCKQRLIQQSEPDSGQANTFSALSNSFGFVMKASFHSERK